VPDHAADGVAVLMTQTRMPPALVTGATDGSGNIRWIEGAFRVPFDSCFDAGQLFNQYAPGGCQSSHGVPRVFEGFLYSLSFGDELRVQRRCDNISAFFGLLKSKDDFPITHSILLHRN
jgi:hypothetical protein